MDRFVAMRVFVVDVVDLAVTAAANKLDILRAMATRHIASLEKSLGARLLHRSSRSLGLTSAGNDVLPYCRQILLLTDDIESVVVSKNIEPHGLIQVASSISFGQSYLAEAMSRYAAQHPKTSVEMVLADRAINLVEERIDLAVQVGNELEQGVIARLLDPLPLGCMCGTELPGARRGTPRQPKDLVQHNCLNHTRFGKIWRFGTPPDSRRTRNPKAYRYPGISQQMTRWCCCTLRWREKASFICRPFPRLPTFALEPWCTCLPATKCRNFRRLCVVCLTQAFACDHAYLA